MAGLLLAVLFLALSGGPAWAHKFRLFATGSPERIEGYAYFSGGVRPEGVEVRALAPDGSLLGATVTGPAGRFSLPVTRQVDHLLESSTGDGHQARWTVPAAELGNAGGAPEGGASLLATSSPVSAAAMPADAAALRAVIESAVAAQLQPLREQLAAYEDKVRLHDILGGLGWIAGLAGLVAWASARRLPRG